jgi:hypothetical protein
MTGSVKVSWNVGVVNCLSPAKVLAFLGVFADAVRYIDKSSGRRIFPCSTKLGKQL